jgi:hypothetical protein
MATVAEKIRALYDFKIALKPNKLQSYIIVSGTEIRTYIGITFEEFVSECCKNNYILQLIKKPHDGNIQYGGSLGPYSGHVVMCDMYYPIIKKNNVNYVSELLKRQQQHNEQYRAQTSDQNIELLRPE